MNIRWINIAITFVNANYDTFSNPLYRGKNFRWRNFPMIVSRLMWVQFFIYYSSGIWRVLRIPGVCLTYMYAYMLSRKKAEIYD